jgi:hypothetical protein
MFKDGWVSLKNFIKHQKVNPKIEKGIENALKDVPKDMIDWNPRENIAYDSLLKPTNYVNVNVNVNVNTNTNGNDNNIVTEQPIPDGIEPLKECDIKKLSGRKLKRKFCNKMHLYYYCPNDKDWCIDNMYKPIRKLTDTWAIGEGLCAKDNLWQFQQGGQYSSTFETFMKNHLNSDRFHAILKSYKPQGNETNIKELMKIIQGVQK